MHHFFTSIELFFEQLIDLLESINLQLIYWRIFSENQTDKFIWKRNK